MNRLWLVLGVAMAVMATAISYALDADLRAVQRGEVKLVCTFKDGERVIEPEMVTGLIDGVWVFSNGYARNCEIIKERR